MQGERLLMDPFAPVRASVLGGGRSGRCGCGLVLGERGQHASRHCLRSNRRLCAGYRGCWIPRGSSVRRGKVSAGHIARHRANCSSRRRPRFWFFVSSRLSALPPLLTLRLHPRAECLLSTSILGRLSREEPRAASAGTLVGRMVPPDAPQFLVDARFAPNDRVLIRSNVDSGLAMISGGARWLDGEDRLRRLWQLPEILGAAAPAAGDRLK